MALRIILSGYSDLASVMASVNEGEICRFISKPWDNETLVPTIRTILKQREALALLQQSLTHAALPVESELLQHASTIELRVRPSQEPFPVAKAIDIIRKLAGVLEEEDMAVFSGLLERQGGRFSLMAELGGTHRFSLEVPLTPAAPALVSKEERS
jgi:response regulator RpfG family c-di-GMP phosphodiesterase